MGLDSYARICVRAAELVGGEEELAKRLSVTRAELSQWCSGAGKPPAIVAIQLAQLLKSETMRSYAGSATGPLPVSLGSRNAGPTTKK